MSMQLYLNSYGAKRACLLFVCRLGRGRWRNEAVFTRSSSLRAGKDKRLMLPKGCAPLLVVFVA
eukprot:347692-Pleurochrysis_carterae.AAC.1